MDAIPYPHFALPLVLPFGVDMRSEVLLSITGGHGDFGTAYITPSVAPGTNAVQQRSKP
jgi:hypothetical protein